MGLSPNIIDREFNKFDNTNCVGSIDIEHFYIHKGKHFVSGYYWADIDSTSVYLHFKTEDSDKRVHILWDVDCTKNGTIQISEKPTISANGTEVPSYNNNRNSANTATLKVYHTPTVSNDGTIVGIKPLGTDATTPAGRNGGYTSRAHEAILEPDTSYLLKFTALNNDTRASIFLEWYEVN